MKLGKVALIALLASTSAITSTTMAHAQSTPARQASFDIPAGDLVAALRQFSKQARVEVIFSAADLRGRKTPGARGLLATGEALDRIVAGSGAELVRDSSGAFLVRISGTAPRLVKSGSGEANAGSAPADEASAEIVVTGTNIRGVAPTGSPFRSINRKQIEQSGYLSIDQFIRTLPDNFSVVDSATLNGAPAARDNAARGAGLNLRGLGPSSTLVLLNGHRLAPAGATGAFVDVSLIPLTAIERVEILPDGASAVYGSDAVAGVVNFILRKRFNGAETSVDYGTATDGRFDNVRASQTVGKSWNSGSILGSYEFFHEGNLDASHRSYVPAVGGPYDLQPASTRHSGIVSVTQDLDEATQLTATGLFSSRRFTEQTTDPDSIDFSVHGKARSLSGNAAVHRQVGTSWDVAVEAGYSQQRDDTDTLADGLAFNINNRSTILSGEVRASGAAFTLPGGDVKIALGAGYRRETFKITAPALTRRVKSAFGELHVPIFGEGNSAPGVRELSVSIAARYDDYSDFGSTFNPKFGVSWKPTADFNVRASYASSFHAPVLANLVYPTSRLFYVLGLPNPDDPNGQTVTILPSSPENPNLGPEKSKSFTAGIDWTPERISGFRVSLTYYNIRFRDRISTPPNRLFNIYIEKDVFAPFIQTPLTPAQIAAIYNSGDVVDIFGDGLQPADVEAFYAFQYQNIALTTTSGLSADVSLSRPLGGGELNVSVSGNHIFYLRNRLGSGSARVSGINTTYNPADTRIRAGAAWTRSGLSVAAFLNYTSGYRNDLATPVAPVSSWTTADLQLSYAVSSWTFALSASNITNAKPPKVITQGQFGRIIGFDPTNASARGRFVTFGIKKSW